MNMESTTSQIKNDKIQRRIKVLPKEVVDRIAAGEVVQNPSSICKELLENSLDAESNNIEIQCGAGGLGLLSVSDDGKGIHPDDFELAVTRFATSKLANFDDLKSIQTFGFRGEALASTSMVSRMTIISRCRKRKDSSASETSCAYKQSFTDGKPNAPKPSPIAGNEGTIIKVEDLFYNIPSRRRAFDGARKENEEYQRVLNIAQRYAIHKARDGIGFLCKKQGGNCDLNTCNMASIKKIQDKKKNSNRTENEVDSTDLLKIMAQNATKDVISHVFGPQLMKELCLVECSEGDLEAVTLSSLQAMKAGAQDDVDKVSNHTHDRIVEKAFNNNNLAESISIESNDIGMKLASDSSYTSNANGFAFRAYGFMSNGSYCVPKPSSSFILFINDRLVESTSLKRALENTYAASLPKGVKPFVYLALYLPCPQVDVNVHPSKREVAFLHMDQLCDTLVSTVKKALFSSKVKAFNTQTLLTIKEEMTSKVTVDSKREKISGHVLKTNETSGSKQILDTSKNIHNHLVSANPRSDLQSDSVAVFLHRESDLKHGTSPRQEISNDIESNYRLDNKLGSKKQYDPKNLVRVVQQHGSLEPYLVQPLTVAKSENLTSTVGIEESNKINLHQPFCEFSSDNKMVDISIPGAFASICRCQVGINGRFSTALPKSRPKRVSPTSCQLASVTELRSSVVNKVNDSWTTKLRESIFVGCISRHRSLIQSGIELILCHHTNMARELFYQLALTRFSGAAVALLDEGGVDVKALIEYALQFEEIGAAGHAEGEFGNDILISDTNAEFANHATKCLADNAAMLRQYYGICFDMHSDSNHLFLTGLPILLEGHSPPASALPIFLLRLATEVDWSDEYACFDGICTELAFFYAELSHTEEGQTSGDVIGASEKKFVQHIIFPAISALLQVPDDLITDGSIMKVAILSQLYKYPFV